MNQLDVGKRAQILHCLVEGNSIRATCRLTDTAKNTVVKLICEAGTACAEYQDRTLRNLKCRRVQLDEIWSFVGCKEKNAKLKHKAKGYGDIWTWTALDSETKLVPCWLVGPRDAASAYYFVNDLKERLASRVQLTTDGLKLYLEAVEGAFGADIDYGMLVKTYGAAPEAPEIRYSPAVCLASYRKIITGMPDRAFISTSHTERQNLTMRMSMRRFTRLTNAFSKKLENHKHAVSLYFMYYNFCRVHQTLRVTPAMEAGISDHVWAVEEIVGLL